MGGEIDGRRMVIGTPKLAQECQTVDKRDIDVKEIECELRTVRGVKGLLTVLAPDDPIPLFIKEVFKGLTQKHVIFKEEYLLHIKSTYLLEYVFDTPADRLTGIHRYHFTILGRDSKRLFYQDDLFELRTDTVDALRIVRDEALQVVELSVLVKELTQDL
jgi:hypothetical protein